MTQPIWVSLQDSILRYQLLPLLEQSFDTVIPFQPGKTEPTSTDAGLWLTDHWDASSKEVNPLSATANQWTVVLYTPGPLADYIDLFPSFGLKNLLIQEDSDTPEFRELLTTLNKLQIPDILGIEKYLAPKDVVRRTLENSEDRYAMKEEVLSFMKPLVKNPRFQDAAKSVMEELLMNAFYSAPVDAQGIHLYQHQDRAVPVQLPSEKAIAFDYGFDGKNLMLAVQDHYGSFNYHALIDALILHFNGELRLQLGMGGAGLGLMEVFRNSSSLVVNLNAGNYTEIIAFLDLSMRFSKFLRKPRSLNIFLSP